MDDEGVVVPHMDVLKEFYPEDFKKPGTPLYLVVNNVKGTQ